MLHTVFVCTLIIEGFFSFYIFNLKWFVWYISREFGRNDKPEFIWFSVKYLLAWSKFAVSITHYLYLQNFLQNQTHAGQINSSVPVVSVSKAALYVTGSTTVKMEVTNLTVVSTCTLRAYLSFNMANFVVYAVVNSFNTVYSSGMYLWHSCLTYSIILSGCRKKSVLVTNNSASLY